MPLVDVGDDRARLRTQRHPGPPLLLIMGMSGTALHWGEPFLEPLREDFDVIAYDHRGVGASTPLDGPVTIAQMAEDAAGAAGRAGARLRARAGHLDGRHDRPGARARTPRARAHADARLHLLRRRGQRARAARGDAAARRGDDVRRPRARAARRLGGQRLAARWPPTTRLASASARSPTQRAVAVPVVHGADAGLRRARHATRGWRELQMPTLVIHGTEDQMLPVAERPPDRLADRRLAAGDPRRRRAPVLLGAARALGRARARARRRARLSEPSARAGRERRAARPSRRRRDAARRAGGRGDADRAAARPHRDAPLRRDGLARAASARAIACSPTTRAATARSAPGRRRRVRLRARSRADLRGGARRARVSSARCSRAPRWARTPPLRFALAHPERVAALALITPVLRSRARARAPSELARWDALAAGCARAAWRGSSRAYDLDEVPDALARDGREGAAPAPGRARAPAARSPTRWKRCRARAPFERSRRARAHLACRRVVVGSRDEADPGHPLAVAERYAQAIPGARAGRGGRRRAARSPIAWQGGQLSRVIAELAAAAG